ncbi:hypothetical protein CVU37_13860 [candidate division BRC1 bacterium HGW-BRC1-1]|jgi:hypothetical protein|nr:MAG: hypothetical protein CVU37_13860 [candidate division BRC1 bacterium HGW-BRC1-1]
MTPSSITAQLLRPRAAGLPTLLLAALLPTVAAWLYFVHWAEAPFVRTLYSGSKVVQFAIPVAWLLIMHQTEYWVRRPRVSGVGSALAFGLAAGLAIIVAYAAWLRNVAALGDFPELIYARLTALGLATPARYIGMALFLSVIHAFLEEYYWRWFFCAHVKWHASRWWAIMMSSVAFTAHHVIVVACFLPPGSWLLTAAFSLPVLAGGMFWAWHYTRHNSLVAVWLSHMLIDVAIMTVGYTAVWG